MMEATTTKVACVGLTTPIWLSSLPEVLQVVVLTLSAGWLVMQMTFKIIDYRAQRKNRNDSTD